VTEGPGVRPGDVDAARRRVAHRAAAERWPLLRLAGRDGQEASSLHELVKNTCARASDGRAHL